jgi:succinyl-diaminopimelate desuccinylase
MTSHGDRERLAAWIADHAPDMDRFTEALVAIGSENPPGMAYRECRDCIAEELRRGSLEPRISGEAIHAFVGPAGPTVYFHGHYDVVPAFTPDQFRPSVRDGRMIGRGTADMKAGLALMLYAARAVNECEIPLQGRIGLTFVPDEETGGERGSRMLADQGLLGREGIAMLTPEPTGTLAPRIGQRALRSRRGALPRGERVLGHAANL